MVKFGEYITLFSLEHFIYIGGLVVMGLLLFLRKEWIWTNRDKVSNGILLVSIAQQILLYTSYGLLFEFSLAESLPFHLSRINSLLGIIFLITKNKRIYNVLSYFSVFALLSFFYPSRVYGITHPIGISFFLNHVITLLLPYYAMIAYQYTVDTKDRNTAFKWLVGYTIFCLILNPLVDGNYFYLKHKPIFSNLPNLIYVPLLLVFSYVLFMVIEQVYKKVEKTLNLHG